MIPLLLLAGCQGIPSTIPDQQGTVTADVAPDLMTITSPDLPYLLVLIARTLGEQQYRSCPAITVNGTTVSAVGKECQDSATVVWTGTMSYSKTSTRETISFQKFGISHTPDGGDWIATGSITVTTPDDHSADIIAARLAITSLVSPTKDYWLNTTTTLTSDESDFYYADNISGTIGMQDWGLADITVAREWVPLVNNCYYGSAGFGTLVIEGANRGDFRFEQNAAYQIPEDPATTARFPAPPATGGTTDTGYPTYPTDTDTDTDSDTDADSDADTDTDSDTDTDADTDTDSDTDTDENDEIVCGCAAVSIDGTSVSECMVPTRTFASAFISLENQAR